MSFGTPAVTPSSSFSSIILPVSSPACLKCSRVPVYEVDEEQGVYTDGQTEDITRHLNFGVELEFKVKLKEKGWELLYLIQTTEQEDENKSDVASDSGSSARTVTGRSTTCDFEWEDIADVMRAVLEQCCLLPAKVMSIIDPDESYDHWIVRKEFSIQGDEADMFGVELVTPILSTNRDWKYLLRSVLDSLNEHFDLIFSPDCGVHIHVSPLHGSWTLPAVKNIAKAVVYFDPIAEFLAPRERNNNLWCSSNTSAPQVSADLQLWNQTVPLKASGKQNAMLKKNHLPIHKYSAGSKLRPDFRQTFTRISTFPTIYSLIGYISPNKCHSWNFKHLAPQAKCGTIEFRRPLMTQDSTMLIRWVLFSIGFVRAAQSPATKWDTIENFKWWPGMEALAAFVLSGIKSQDGEEAFSILDGLFENCMRRS